MARRVGYPDEFEYLDDEHDEIWTLLDGMRQVRDGESGDSPKLITNRILQKLKEHSASEEDVMRRRDYPERELHEKYHEVLIASIDLILQIFDMESMVEHRDQVAHHIEGKMSEEIFVDRLFAEFLGGRAAAGGA